MPRLEEEFTAAVQMVGDIVGRGPEHPVMVSLSGTPVEERGPCFYYRLYSYSTIYVRPSLQVLVHKQDMLNFKVNY